MENQMSLIEIALEIMESVDSPINIYTLIEETLAKKGINDEDGTLAAKLYTDITISSKFVYMGDDLWDLKKRQSLKQYDKDGSSFNTDNDYEDEDDSDNEGYEYETKDDYEDEDEDEDEDDDDEDEDLDSDDSDSDDYEDEDSLDDDDDYDDDDLDEDEDDDEGKYNKIMDDYEDLYED